MTSLQNALQNAPMMRELLAHPGWEIIARELKLEMDRCTAIVMDSEDDPAERDRLIRRYRSLKECLEKPSRILEAAVSVIEADAPEGAMDEA